MKTIHSLENTKYLTKHIAHKKIFPVTFVSVVKFQLELVVDI